MRLLNLRHLRRRPSRAIIGGLSIAAGVSLAASVLVVSGSFQRSFDDFFGSLAGPAPLRVLGPTRGTLGPDDVAAAEGVGGVDAAVPVIQTVALANTTEGDEMRILAVGFDCRVEALFGDLGCSAGAIEGSGESSLPLLSAHLAKRLGPDGVIRTDLGPQPVGQALAVPGLDEVNEGLVAAYPLPAAQARFARPEGVDVIYVMPAGGVDLSALRTDLTAAVGEHNTVMDATEPPIFLSLFSGLILPLLGMISLFALAIGALLVHNTMTLALEERRRSLAIAGATGAGRGVLVGGVLLEAGVVGLLGGTLGAVGAIALAHPLIGGMQDFVGRIGGLRLSVHITSAPFVIGAVLGCVAAVAASIPTALRAARLDVVAELRGLAPEAVVPTTKRRRVVFLAAIAVASYVGVLLARTSLALHPSAPLVGQGAMLIHAIAVFWIVAAIAPACFRWLQRAFKGSSPHMRLACANLAREGGRTSVMLVATVAAVGLGLALASITLMIEDGIASSVNEEINGVSVSTQPRSNSLNLDSRPSPGLIESLAEVPGVASVDRWYGLGVGTTNDTFIGVGASDRLCAGVPLGHGRCSTPYPVMAGTVEPDAFERGEVLIGMVLARDRGVRPGDTITVPGRDGMVDLPVQAVWANGDFNGREITMPVWQMEELWGTQPPVAVELRPEAGVTTAELARRVETTGLDPYLTALTPDDQFAEVARESSQFADPFWTLQRGMMIVAFAAVLFTLLLAAVRRRREFALVAAVGMSPGKIASMVAFEAAAVALVGTVLGSAAGLVIADVFRRAVFLVIPFDFPFRVDLVAPLLYGALTTVILLLASAWPAWRTARLKLAPALRYE